MQNNSVPNSNNLFSIFQSQVESMSALQDIIIKSKIDKKTTQLVIKATSVLVESLDAIFSTLKQISLKDAGDVSQTMSNVSVVTNGLSSILLIIGKFDKNTTKNFESSSNNIEKSVVSLYVSISTIASMDTKAVDKATDVVNKLNEVLAHIANTNINTAEQSINNIVILSNCLTPVFALIDNINQLSLINTLLAHIRIMRMSGIVKHLWLFILSTSMVPPVITTISINVLSGMVKVMGEVVNLINVISKVNWVKVWFARTGIRRVYELMYGNPAKKQKGLIHLITKLNDPKYNKAKLVMGAVSLRIISTTIKKFAGTVAILGLVLPLALLAVPTVKLLSVIIRDLVRVFVYAGRRFKGIIKGSIALEFMVASLGFTVLALVLTGLTVVAGAKMIGIAMVVILGIVGMMIVIGLVRPLIKRGTRSIKNIAVAVMLLGMVAITMALLGQFVVANWKGFLITLAYIAVLVGVFFLLAITAGFVKQGTKNILLIALAVALISGIAILMALLGQYIQTTWEQMLVVGLFMGILVGVVWMVALARKKIEQGTRALIIVAGFALLMTLVIWLIALISENYDMEKLVACVGIMILLVTAIGTLAFVASKIKNIEAGIFALGEIIVITGLLTLVMYGLVEISKIADPTDILIMTGVMILIVGAMGVLAWTAGMLLAGPQAIAFELGIPALMQLGVITALLSPIMLALAAACAIADPLEMLAMAGIMTAIVVAVGAMTLAAAAYLAGPQAIWFGLGVSAMVTLGAVGGVLAGIILGIAAAKKAAESSGIVDPEQIAEILALPLEVFTMEKFGPKGKDSIIDLIGDLPGWGLTKALFKIGMLRGIVGQISGIAMTLQKIASLNMPISWDKDGKPNQFVAMKAKDFSDAAINCSNILFIAASMFGDDDWTGTINGESVTIHSVPMEALEKATWWTQLKVARLGKIIGHVGNMAKTLTDIASLRMPDWEAGFDPETGRPKGYVQMKAQDFQDAATNAATILEMCAKIFEDTPYTLTIGGASFTINTQAKVLKDLDNISNRAEKKVAKLSSIVGHVGTMANVLQKMAGMYVPDVTQGYNSETGYWNAYRKMTDEEFTSASLNVAKIINTLAGCLADETLQENLKKIGGDSWWEKDNSETLTKILAPVDNISTLVDIVQRLGNGQYVKKWKYGGKNGPEPLEYGNWDDLLSSQEAIAQRIIKMVDIVAGPMAMLGRATLTYQFGGFSGNLKYTLEDSATGAEKLAKAIEPGNAVVESIVKIYNDTLQKLDQNKFANKWGYALGVLECAIDVYAGYNKNKPVDVNVIDKVGVNITKTKELFTQINTVDLEKLKNASSLMKNISDLSKSIQGNFEGLAKVINEQLLDVLEKLTEALGAIEKKDFSVKYDQAPTPTPTPGDVLKGQSGSAGVKDKKQQQQQQQQQQNTLNNTTIESISRTIDSINGILTAWKNQNFQ